MLEDGKIGTILGVEKMLGEETGNVLVSISNLNNPIILKQDDLNIVKKYVKPKAYPYINDQEY